MKKIGDLMKEIGFNSEAKDSVKEAFIKHLIKQSTGVLVETPSEKKAVAAYPEKIFSLKSKEIKQTSQQLSFDFENSDSKKVI